SATPRPSTCISSGYGRRWRPIHPTRAASSRCAVWATSSTRRRTDRRCPVRRNASGTSPADRAARRASSPGDAACSTTAALFRPWTGRASVLFRVLFGVLFVLFGVLLAVGGLGLRG